MEWFLEGENSRIVVFVLSLGLFAGAEALFPFRKFKNQRKQRWLRNFTIVLIDTALLRLFFPLIAVGVAIWAQDEDIGLFNQYPVNYWLSFIFTFLFFDMSIYWQHRVFHKVPVFWRVHRMHHSDPQFDVSTGLRFHPIEIALSMLFKMSIVLVLGPPVAAVVAFEIILNSCSLFNHMNLNFKKADRFIRYFLVTPNMHRIHHSAYRPETDSNFSFCLSIWDRIFRSYTDEPANGQDKILIGLKQFREDSDQTVEQLIYQPFK